MKYYIAAVHEILGKNIGRNPATICMDRYYGNPWLLSLSCLLYADLRTKKSTTEYIHKADKLILISPFDGGNIESWAIEQTVHTIRQRKPGIPIQVIYVYPKARLDFEEVMERREKRSIQLKITHKIIDPAEIKIDFCWQ
jgi:hypothetical protein